MGRNDSWCILFWKTRESSPPPTPLILESEMKDYYFMFCLVLFWWKFMINYMEEIRKYIRLFFLIEKRQSLCFKRNNKWNQKPFLILCQKLKLQKISIYKCEDFLTITTSVMIEKMASAESFWISCKTVQNFNSNRKSENIFMVLKCFLIMKDKETISREDIPQ